jgi:hypothetical protein
MHSSDTNKRQRTVTFNIPEDNISSTQPTPQTLTNTQHTPIATSVQTAPTPHKLTSTSHHDATEASESTSARAIAIARNNKRIHKEMNFNHDILGTYTPDHITVADCLPNHLHLPLRPLEQNPDLLRAIQEILSAPIKPLAKPPFKFQMSKEAAAYNSNIIRENNFNIHKIISSTLTNCTPGIEFREPELLQLIFHRHELWEFTKTVLLQGADLYFQHEPSDQQRIDENNALIAFNNHQKAKLLPDIIHESIKTDVQYGFSVPVEIQTINQIPGAMVCPFGIAQQTTLSPDGSRIAKNRLTHDQTFSVLDNSESVNNILDQTAYPELVYGHCMRRIML